MLVETDRSHADEVAEKMEEAYQSGSPTRSFFIKMNQIYSIKYDTVYFNEDYKESVFIKVQGNNPIRVTIYSDIDLAEIEEDVKKVLQEVSESDIVQVKLLNECNFTKLSLDFNKTSFDTAVYQGDEYEVEL